MKIVKWLAPFFALIAVLCCSTLAFASSRTALNPRIPSDIVGLLPDPSAYCVKNPPFQLQQQDDGWQVQFQKLVGDPLQNNWGCQYLVLATVPVTGDATAVNNEGNFPIWLSTYTAPIDWNAMCNQQYPGAHAEWSPGPETGVYGAPWVCVGVPGVIYDPAEQSDGTHEVISGSGGW
jgi:hypothetical protein